MGRKGHSFEYVRGCFEEQGCELLETEYINSKTKMRYRCSCGNISEIIFNSFQQGKRCKKCGYKKVGNNRRFSFKYVDNYFKEQGCELLEKEYINNYTKMRYRCSCGNISEIIFSSFQQGNRCKKCANRKRSHTFEYVYNYFKEQGCELLEKEYINSRTKMRYRCSCGSVSEISFDCFKIGKRCKKCADRRRAHTFEYVKQYFEEQGCELLETEYINCKTKMKYRCSCGNISKIRFSEFRSGCRCKECGNKKNSESQKLTFEYVKNYFEEQGCELLEIKYINNNHKMKYRCNCGNISKITFSCFQQGNRCRKCSGCEKYTFEYVKQYFLNNDCELLEKDYKDVFFKMKFRCICGRIDKISFASFKRGCRCVKCGAKKRSGKNHYKWIEDREAMKENKSFSQRCRSMLKMVLNKINKKKKNKTSILLGYSIGDLQNYIYNHFNWKNVKNKKWHLDHVFPIKAFLDYGVRNIKLINCFENLQPLEAVENLRKSDNYNKEEFENWLKSKDYEIYEV